MACSNTRPSEIDVIDLAATDNGLVLTQQDVSVVDVAAGTENDRNTSAFVKADPSFTHGGEVQIFYDRWNLQTLFGQSLLFIGTVDPAQAGDVICAVNAEYGTQLPMVEMDVVKVNDQTARITAKPDSAGYIGTVDVQVRSIRVPLSERLTATQLSGFEYPGANDPGWNNIIITDGEIYSIAGTPPLKAQDTDVTNGDLQMRVINRAGGTFNYPINLQATQTGTRLSGIMSNNTPTYPLLVIEFDGYTHPKKGKVNKSFSEFADEYDITVTLTYPGASRIDLKPVFNGARTQCSWNGSGVSAGPVTPNTNVKGKAAFTFNWGTQYVGTSNASLTAQLAAVRGMPYSTAQANSGVRGTLRIQVTAVPKNGQGQTLTFFRFVDRTG